MPMPAGGRGRGTGAGAAAGRGPAPEGRGATPAAGRGGPGGGGYLGGADQNDPMVNPIRSNDIMSKFPPTLIITGTRGMELSGALYTHEQLVKLGVEAELHVWEGLFHGFFYNPDVPECKDAYNVMVKFFDRHLGH
jgi:acetyl esterase/lipase